MSSIDSICVQDETSAFNMQAVSIVELGHPKTFNAFALELDKRPGLTHPA
jgi:hypothetical protein